MPVHKIRSSYKPTAEQETFIGDTGDLFYDAVERVIRISDGVTPGGISISSSGIEGLSSNLDSTVGTLTVEEGYHIIPEVDSVSDLGAPDRKWRDLYISGGTIYIGDQGATIEENAATGALIIPSGSMVKNHQGSMAALATVDPNDIDWNTVVQGLDLDLTYATTAYVDGKVREASIKAANMTMTPNGISNLADLIDVGVTNPVHKSALKYNRAAGKWEAGPDEPRTVQLFQDGVIETTEGTVRWYSPGDITISSIVVRIGTVANVPITIDIKQDGNVEETIILPLAIAKLENEVNISMDTDSYLTVDTTTLGNATGESLSLEFFYTFD